MMMGVQTAPAQLFYDFCLNDHVPDDHLVRRIDQFIDLEKVRTELRPFYSSIGRPSIDPELMMRMLIVGYCMGIRSERRLCEEIHLNLAYRWFCRLGLDGRVPDHSTFSRNRHGRFRQSDILRHLFETVVQRCLREGLVGGEGFAVDASLIAADANKQRSVPGDQWRIGSLDADAGRAVREYLETLDDAAFGAASEVRPKFVSLSDPAARWTGAHKGHAFFLCHQLSDRYRECGHSRRRSQPGHPPGGVRRLTHHDRPNCQTLWHQAPAPCGRQRLWLGREPGMAHQGASDRTAHPGVRQVQPDRRHLLPVRLRVRR
jgi:transposase